MKFCCVTPCYNADEHIEYTILSVLTQSVFIDGSNELYYIIKDGGSDDTTLEKVATIAREYREVPNITIEIITKKDNGLYDALATSFQTLPRGNIYSYINAGDYYSPFAFEIVAEIFTTHNIQFLTGLNCVCNEKNHLLSCHLPFKYKKSLLLSGCYGTVLPNIQQESTFWGPRLHREIDFDCLKYTILAGDYLLWKTFITHEQLYIVSAQLAGFKIHKGQLTERSQAEYKEEVRQLSGQRSIATLFTALMYRLFWYLPNKLKITFSKQIFVYNHNRQAYILPHRCSEKHR